jgi:hypothetical protein
MSTQTLTVAYAPVAGFPAGSVVASILATITGANPANSQSQSVAPGTASVVFNNVVDDNYSLTVEGVDASGNVFGTPATGTFTAGAGGGGTGTVSLNLPASATVAQS